MDRAEWEGLFEVLEANLAVIQAWPASPPEPLVLRCAHSRHRTLGHLRACQEQWIWAAEAFVAFDSPRIKILHPWRQFEAKGYATESWESHLENFTDEREWWLALRDADWERGGVWNRKADTLGGLTKRLVEHECYHIRLLASTDNLLEGYISQSEETRA